MSPAYITSIEEETIMGGFGSRGGLFLHAPLKRPSCSSKAEVQEKTERTEPCTEAPAFEKTPLLLAVSSAMRGTQEGGGTSEPDSGLSNQHGI